LTIETGCDAPLVIIPGPVAFSLFMRIGKTPRLQRGASRRNDPAKLAARSREGKDRQEAPEYRTYPKLSVIDREDDIVGHSRFNVPAQRRFEATLERRSRSSEERRGDRALLAPRARARGHAIVRRARLIYEPTRGARGGRAALFRATFKRARDPVGLFPAAVTGRCPDKKIDARRAR